MEIEVKYLIKDRETADKIWEDKFLTSMEEEGSRETLYMKSAYFDTEDGILSKNDIASLNKDACVIITPLGDYSEIRKELINGGYPKEKVYTVEESINIE